MQISAELKVKDRVLAVDATTGDPYDSIEVEASKIRIVMPRPLWLNATKGKDKGDKGARIGMIAQWTSSGTIDIKFEDLTPREMSEDELIEAAKAKVRADRLATPNPNDVDMDSDEFKEAFDEIKKTSGKSQPEDFIDPVIAKLDEDGNVIKDEKR